MSAENSKSDVLETAAAQTASDETPSVPVVVPPAATALLATTPTTPVDNDDVESVLSFCKQVGVAVDESKWLALTVQKNFTSEFLSASST